MKSKHYYRFTCGSLHGSLAVHIKGSFGFGSLAVHFVVRFGSVHFVVRFGSVHLIEMVRFGSVHLAVRFGSVH